MMMIVLFHGNIMCACIGARTVYPSGAHEFTLDLK